jgi:hypothetical protein
MMSQKGEIRLTYNASHARWENNPARQIAYSVWASDPRKPVTELLPAIESAIGEKLAVRTVQEWRKRDQWESRLARDMLAGSEVYVAQVVTDLRVAAPFAVAYLDAVAQGRQEPDAQRISAAKAILSENRGMLAMMADALRPKEEEGEVALSPALSDEELYALAMQGRDADQEE